MSFLCRVLLLNKNDKTINSLIKSWKFVLTLRLSDLQRKLFKHYIEQHQTYFIELLAF